MNADRLVEALEWITRAISGLGFLLPFAIVIFLNMAGRKNKQQKKDTPAPKPKRQPATMSQPRQPVASEPMMETSPAAPTWQDVFNPPAAVPQTGQPKATSRYGSDTFGQPSEKLQWGSAFDENDAGKQVESLKWGSAFDADQAKTKWGFDDSEWGSGFAPKEQVEPKITIG